VGGAVSELPVTHSTLDPFVVSVRQTVQSKTRLAYAQCRGAVNDKIEGEPLTYMFRVSSFRD